MKERKGIELNWKTMFILLGIAAYLYQLLNGGGW